MKNKHSVGIFAFISTAIWAIAMFVCAGILRNNEFSAQIQYVLGAAAAGHVVFVWAPLGAWASKKDKTKE